MPPTATTEHECVDDRLDRRAAQRADRTDAATRAAARAATRTATENEEPRTSVPLGVALTVVGVVGTSVWLTWRIVHLEFSPIGLAFLAAELGGVLGGVAVASGLAASRQPHRNSDGGERDSHWFAHSVADLVGRSRADDLHHDVIATVRAAPRWHWRSSADAAVIAVLLDGPRRLLMIAAVVAGLLFGVSPFGRPPWWAIGAVALGTLALSAAHVVLGRGRIRPGDRVRWTYGALGEVVGRCDVAGVAPRRWVGSVAAVVVVSVAVALRGMSDQWTHGLPAMGDDDRIVALTLGAALILGALYTIATTPRPAQADAHLVARHLEEHAARQTLLVAAVTLAMVGLVAGLMPHDQIAEAPPTNVAPSTEVADG